MFTKSLENSKTPYNTALITTYIPPFTNFVIPSDAPSPNLLSSQTRKTFPKVCIRLKTFFFYRNFLKDRKTRFHLEKALFWKSLNKHSKNKKIILFNLMLQKIFQKTFSQLKLFLSRKRTKKIVQQKNNIHKHETLKIYCLSNGNKNENQSVLNFKGGKKQLR